MGASFLVNNVERIIHSVEKISIDPYVYWGFRKEGVIELPPSAVFTETVDKVIERVRNQLE